MKTNSNVSPNSSGVFSPTATATAAKPQQQFKRCSVPGCPTRGEVDETGTCSAHGAKRKRCKIEGCPNGVVQGGVCVKHGAKRRICKYPGCEKNTKSHGLCSKHGPARKRCNVPKCSNVAVRAGKCKSHGAYAAECTVMNCFKQSVSGGLCIRHYKEMTVAVAAQNAFRFAQMSQMNSLAAQGVQVPVAGLVAMNPIMNPTAVGLVPLQMQGMGMPVPVSLPLVSAQTGMPNQIVMPNQMGLPNQMGVQNQMGMSNQRGLQNQMFSAQVQMAYPSQMQMANPSQMQMGMSYPVNGLAAGVGAQVLNDRPPTKTGGDSGMSNTFSSHGKDTGDDSSTGTSESKGSP
mmetsp:Transcript_25567/g.39297  ORF Transcript_25567/g.39297 Transcript_25567/m.39297 type:complete len:345 (+) Transcript_25567:109-1143(+)